MTKICGAEASRFAKTALQGFALAHASMVRLLPDGVMRRDTQAAPKVVLVVGGGSGHYPAFLGYVGKGFADAAVAGDVFASPSTQAIIRTARAAHQGRGIILGYGNYAGDVLNFSIAAERLNAEGIPTRLMAVSDDIASAPTARHLERRGIAGDLAILKIMGAAAEEGLDLDAVMAIGEKANRRTQSLGVAFAGCTLPGEAAPLFDVTAGQMAIGLGVHGEQGLEETPIPDAQALAERLCTALLAEKPSDGSQSVAVILNGLGATKYEELFVLWTHITDILTRHGLKIVAPCVGEFITSLDMAGCSLTLTWLDAALEPLWRAPVISPALTRERIEGAGLQTLTPEPAEATVPPPAATEEGRQGGRCVARVMTAIAQALAAAEAELGRIDAQTGDGDHGQGMARGSDAAAKAARAAAHAGGGARTVLAIAADAWADRAGGTSGALWGAGLHAFSTKLSDEKQATAHEMARGVMEARDVIMRLGGAKPGDKTLIDALDPLATSLAAETQDDPATNWERGAAAAQREAEVTRLLQARRGRSRTHGERSIGHPDAGALSLALVAKVVAESLKQTAEV
ncbi:dihydroxyacetone kinase family protein [Candidatus Kirkpatrickella diaphorinae]|uniref:Dihydroxyacetone kinase family protein n=1 Tax=Candidatus Kirkpatrickella diaphorinae TaxID=2984322 RepID=A0ABY6GMD8_9PROT|nr:dihydroxyacetone kinase family protein [Candidatus Kirkpatrickella diaphorinae]UYH51931.1 dihydroxyacetone kinase family protein [Candidatus Kirkpatrickella diaphorinae]